MSGHHRTKSTTKISKRLSVYGGCGNQPAIVRTLNANITLLRTMGAVCQYVCVQDEQKIFVLLKSKYGGPDAKMKIN